VIQPIQCGFAGQRDDSHPWKDGAGWHKISGCFSEFNLKHMRCLFLGFGTNIFGLQFTTKLKLQKTKVWIRESNCIHILGLLSKSSTNGVTEQENFCSI
jgi:hypothetical protein